MKDKEILSYIDSVSNENYTSWWLSIAKSSELWHISDNLLNSYEVEQWDYKEGLISFDDANLSIGLQQLERPKYITNLGEWSIIGLVGDDEIGWICKSQKSTEIIEIDDYNIKKDIESSYRFKNICHYLLYCHYLYEGV